MTGLVISGIRGRMGQALAQLAAAADDVRVIAGIGRAPAEGDEAAAFGCPVIVNVVDAGAVIGEADVVVDFSTPEGTRELLQYADYALERRAVIVGTTGLDDDIVQALDALSNYGAVLTAANFSIGVNVLIAMLERIAPLLDAQNFDVEIVEAHHGAKIDAPSGTALALAQAVASARYTELAETRRDGRSGRTGVRPKGEIGIHSVRGGSVAGEHRVLFLGERERIELTHAAGDRSLFAEGALHAARWITQRAPGRYTMADVLGIGR